MVAMRQASNMIRYDIDEIVINGMLGIYHKIEIFKLFSRVVATFRQKNPKEVKAICM